MNQYVAIFFLSLSYYSTAFTQCEGEVREVFDAISQKVTNNQGYSIDFSIIMEYVGEPPVQQKGRLTVLDNKFHLSLPDQTYISDGISLWIHLPQANEVQVFTMEDNQEWKSMSPIAMMEQYCSEEYLSRSLGTEVQKGRALTTLEFTPIDKDQTLFKVKMGYDPKKVELTQLKTFNKDGSRITLNASEYHYGIADTQDIFTFNPAGYPGIHIEDLR